MNITLIIHEDGTIDMHRDDIPGPLDDIAKELSGVKGKSLAEKATNAACMLRSLRADARIKGREITACRRDLALTKAAMEILHYVHGEDILHKAIGVTKTVEYLKSRCHACAIEAEFGTEEDPHPIPEKYHTCPAILPAKETNE